jgi:hypothetical protein
MLYEVGGRAQEAGSSRPIKSGVFSEPLALANNPLLPDEVAGACLVLLGLVGKLCA